MDILIVNNYISKIASQEDCIEAMKYIENFIDQRKENLNYYIILLSSVVESIENTTKTEGWWEYVTLHTPEAEIPEIFLKELFAAPIPNKSICLRQDINPFVKSNPNINIIFDTINEELNKYNEEIGNVYILSPKKINPIDTLFLKESLIKSNKFNLEKTSIIIIEK